MTHDQTRDAMREGREKFAAIVNEMGRMLGTGAAPSIAMDEVELFVQIDMDDTRFLVGHAQSHPSTLSVRCLFGPIGTLRGSAHDLLALNIDLMDAGATFGLEPDSGQVIYGFHVDLESIGVTELLDSLHHVASWREECVRTGSLSAASSPSQVFGY